MNSGRLYFVHVFMSLLPPTRFFGLKRIILRWAGACIGANARITSSARFYLTGDLTIGADSWIGHDVVIVGGDAAVIIGSQVDIAPRVVIVTGTHELFGRAGRAAGRGYSLPVTIGNGVWLGASVTILGGVTVGNGSVVAAAALVNRDVDPGDLVGGIPARKLKRHTGQ